MNGCSISGVELIKIFQRVDLIFFERCVWSHIETLELLVQHLFEIFEQVGLIELGKALV